MGKKAKTVLANIVPGLEYPRPFNPKYQFIGSLINGIKPLDCSSKTDTLCSFVSKASAAGRKIIYVSFGTAFTPRSSSLKAVFSSLLELTTDPTSDVSVVWTLPKIYRHYLPRDAVAFNSTAEIQNEHFIFQLWVAQPELLAHPATKIFISYVITNFQIFRPNSILSLPFVSDTVAWEERQSRLRPPSLCFASPLLRIKEA